MNSDTRIRSLTKMLTYRIVVIALLAALTFYFTGNAGEATAITIVFNVGGSLAYYGYERLWGSISWGKDGTGSHSSSIGALRPPAAGLTLTELEEGESIEAAEA